MVFLIDWWLLLISIIALVVGFHIAIYWKSITAQKKLCGFFVIALVLHMIEEYVYPGGFHYIFNLIMGGTTDPTRFPMNRLSCMATNLSAVIAFVIVYWKWSDKLFTLLTIIFFTIGQLITHSIFGILSFVMFGSVGQSFPYSPGLINTVFMMSPVAIGCVLYIYKNRKVLFNNSRSTLIQVGLSILVIAFTIGGLIFIPNNLLGSDIHTPYKFKNSGYYERFKK